MYVYIDINHVFGTRKMYGFLQFTRIIYTMCTHLLRLHGILIRVIRRRCFTLTGENIGTFWAFTFKCRVPTLVNNLNIMCVEDVLKSF